MNSPASTGMCPELAVIVPAWNERENIPVLHAALDKALRGLAWEIIIVDDDSRDGTAEVAREIASRDGRLRCLQRLGRRGLASACIEGVLATSAPYLCIIDADMQHDERIIPALLDRLRRENLDLIVGSRYVDAGSAAVLAGHRLWMSHLATRIARMVTGISVADPMSGFFMFRRPLFESVMRQLSGSGFKILLDILISKRGTIRVAEHPYTMRAREFGVSKLSLGVIWDFFLLLAHKLLGRVLPARFISFATVGVGGLAVHMTVLWLGYRVLGVAFAPAQAAATVIAMTGNFFLNNLFTYRDRRLHGWQAVRGLFSFYVACSLGAIFNVALATWAADSGLSWWLAGGLGVLAGAVWNYASTAILTWRDPDA